MIWPQLHTTLAELVAALDPSEQVGGIGIEVAELSVPLELSTTVEEGNLLVLGRAPHSRWKAGFLPRVSMATLRVERVGGEP